MIVTKMAVSSSHSARGGCSLVAGTISPSTSSSRQDATPSSELPHFAINSALLRPRWASRWSTPMKASERSSCLPSSGVAGEVADPAVEGGKHLDKVTYGVGRGACNVRLHVHSSGCLWQSVWFRSAAFRRVPVFDPVAFDCLRWALSIGGQPELRLEADGDGGLGGGGGFRAGHRQSFIPGGVDCR